MGDLIFKPASGGDLILQEDGGTAALTIDTDGDVSINNGSIVISTAGQGITFGGDPDSRTAVEGDRTLYDYEQGTFTPLYTGKISTGTYNYARNSGWYTKIGNTVNIVIWLEDITPTSEGSGDVRITGLPFTTANNPGRMYYGSIWLSRWNLTGEGYHTYLSSNVDFVDIQRPTSGSGGVGDGLALTDRASVNADMGFNLTYEVD